MFDLEKAIADWRRLMLALGIKSPVPLEELESHLREEIQRQMQLGLNAARLSESPREKSARLPNSKGNSKK